MNWLKLIEMFVPLILRSIPGFPAAIVPFVVQGITLAEGISGASGAEKLVISQGIVSASVGALNAVKPGTIDAQSIDATVAAGISATVQAVNLIHGLTSKSST